MKHIPKNNVILKTQDMSQNKTKQNKTYNETVSLKFRLVLTHIVGFQDDDIPRNMFHFIKRYIWSGTRY